MALREVSEYTTRWRNKEGAGDVSVGYEVNGQKTWSVIQVGTSTELCMLVDLLGRQDDLLFDDEAFCLRTPNLPLADDDSSVERLMERGASSSISKPPSRSATDYTDPLCLRNPEPMRNYGPTKIWTAIERRRK